MEVELVWATPQADKLLAYIARVSNPSGQDKPIGTLFRYMMENGHSSPFEMCTAVVEINTTRDIGRQILRHRSFSFQEFSQRYANASLLPKADLRECRLQDTKNRQNSLESDDEELARQWASAQTRIQDAAQNTYDWALARGIAKEQARVVLPEGLTSTRMYMSGTMRSWIHYLKSRLDPSTQKEHREIAVAIREILRGEVPIMMEAFFPTL